MLQIRVATPAFTSGISFTDEIVLEMADDITLKKSVNSSDEGISFTLPLTDPKISNVTYLRWWLCYDTITNLRVNYGPIHQITRTSGEKMQIQGPGRSAVLADFYKSIQTFYYPIDQFLDDLRFENIAAEPRTSTIININTDSEYYGLSKRSKDSIIDEQTGYITIGRDVPARGTIKTDQFWAGIGRSDWVTVDLGENYTISKARLLLPWWGGATINNNRAYDWSLSSSTDNSGFSTRYSTPVPNYHIMNPATHGTTIYFGEDGYEMDQVVGEVTPVNARYWKLDISGTHAWYGSVFIPGDITDEWEWECNGSNSYKGGAKESPTVVNEDGTEADLINKTELTPSNDCYASAIELDLSRKIIDREDVVNLSYHQIENDNRQITYYHTPINEMITAGSSVKFEPGGHFRKITFTGSSEVKDEWNNVIYNGAGTLDLPAGTSYVLFTNSGSVVTYADTWPSEVDVFSYGGTHSYTTSNGDYAIVHFRGVSFKWFASIPSTVTPGTVSIELRSKSGGAWGSWGYLGVGDFYWNGELSTTDSSSLVLPSDVHAEKVFEILAESLILADETVHEIRITNLGTNYVSIDAFAGFWSASYSDLNEDDPRISVRLPNEAIQSFDPKYTFSSVYEFIEKLGSLTKQGFTFTGDRVLVYSKKGPGYGVLKLGLFRVDPELPLESVAIPGGELDGSLEIDLTNTYEVSQVIVFDSNDYFTDTNALAWDTYRLGIYKPDDPGSIWVDGVGAHETSGLSVKFQTTSHLEILKSTAEALQLEWDITETGLKVAPRIGIDTEEIFAEGRGTTITIQNVEDAEPMASMLLTQGSDIDGLPLTAVVEDKNTRSIIGRTVQRTHDFRSIGDYFMLIGASRTELKKRREPEQRIAIKRVGTLPVSVGDTFIVKTPTLEHRVRANTITRTQSSNGGTEYQLECTLWPPIE